MHEAHLGACEHLFVSSRRALAVPELDSEPFGDLRRRCVRHSGVLCEELGLVLGRDERAFLRAGAVAVGLHGVDAVL